MTNDVFLQCEAVLCRMRFPAPADTACPRCGASTVVTAPRYASVRLPWSPVRDVRLLLDNVRSAQNVGAILRTSEAVGVAHVYLAGITAPASHREVAKAALGSEQRVATSSHNDAVALAQELRQQGSVLWALECTASAHALGTLAMPPDASLTLIVGHEVAGIDASLLAVCHAHVALPMAGQKNSLNVGHAAAAALYSLMAAQGVGARP